MLLRLAAIVVVVGFASACEDAGSSVAGPGGAPLDLTGSFVSSTLTDSNGFTSMRWVLTQTGDQITGTMTISGNAQTGTGTVSGTLTGRTLTFSASVPAGGFSTGLPSCAAVLSGTAQNVTNTTITGTYTGTNSCLATPISGTVTLQRQ
jgi:hypothetical protein